MTVEEKAKESANKYCLNDEQHKAIFSSGYRVGYNEAMRWRDPKDELPKYYKKVELKIKRDNSIDYVNAALLADDDGSLFFGDYNFVIFIKIKDVIGWRPIEL